MKSFGIAKSKSKRTNSSFAIPCGKASLRNSLGMKNTRGSLAGLGVPRKPSRGNKILVDCPTWKEFVVLRKHLGAAGEIRLAGSMRQHCGIGEPRYLSVRPSLRITAEREKETNMPAFGRTDTSKRISRTTLSLYIFGTHGARSSRIRICFFCACVCVCVFICVCRKKKARSFLRLTR